MLLSVKCLILFLLVWIFIQDMIWRAVYWAIFPMLVLLLLLLEILQKVTLTNILSRGICNLTFLGIQFLLISFWFAIKEKRWINITTDLLGWGDIALLLCIALYVSFLNFLSFYLGSIIIILLIWLPIQTFYTNKNVPLAGLQSLIFAILLVIGWYFPVINLTDDRFWIEILNAQYV